MATVPNPVPPTAAPRRSPWRHVWRAALVVLILVVLAIAGAAWYASTPQFANRVRTELISVIERATGGRVELGAFHWSLRHLDFEADNLTIHGLEAPGQIPYAHVDRAYVEVKILSFFRPKIALNYVGATHPVVHLLVNADGSTNAPHPKAPSTSSKPVQDTLFDLAVDRTEVTEGLVLIDEQAIEQRAIPFDLAANHIGVQLRYVPAPAGAADAKAAERYTG